MEFHVWTGQSTTPLVFEDETLARQYIANQSGVVVVKKYQHALIGVEVYGTPGGNPMPPKPSTAIPTATVAINHVMRYGGASVGA